MFHCKTKAKRCVEDILTHTLPRTQIYRFKKKCDKIKILLGIYSKNKKCRVRLGEIIDTMVKLEK